MKKLITLSIVCFLFLQCNDQNPDTNNEGILGYDLLEEITGHWIGTNQTAFGFFEWFTFDFRPISASHVHSIYEGATVQNIITSLFVANYEGQQQIMARNGGWLGNQYRATYYVMDKAEINGNEKYYRLVDAKGKGGRSYIEFRIKSDSMFMDAYKDNSGMFDEPVHHMGFKGKNINPTYADASISVFGFPQMVDEVDLNGKFENLIDDDSALFLEESLDPFPKSAHQNISELTINIIRINPINNKPLFYFLSKEPLVDVEGKLNLENINSKVNRTISIGETENSFTNEYLHFDEYYVTVFSDEDGNSFPSVGDISSVSKLVDVPVNTNIDTDIIVNLQIN